MCSQTPRRHIKAVAGVMVGAVTEVVEVQIRVGTSMILGMDAGITHIDLFL